MKKTEAQPLVKRNLKAGALVVTGNLKIAYLSGVVEAFVSNACGLNGKGVRRYGRTPYSISLGVKRTRLL